MLTIGADPEVFVKKDGEYHSAYGLVQGTKEHPFPVQNGAVQVDGMALEFNIDPAEEEEQFLFNIQDVMRQLKAMVPEYDVVADPVAQFTEALLATQPDEALDLGCEPDFNAWTEAVNPRPDATSTKRTGAGHVHMGWTDGASGRKHSSMCSNLIRQMDYYLGLPSLLFDNDNERRELYGKAGAFRPKSYGVEYRVLSNRWLSDEGLTRWVFKAAQNCFESMRGGQLVHKYGDIQHIINNSDVDTARKIIEAENLLVPEGV
jgi:hypothetical protein